MRGSAVRGPEVATTKRARRLRQSDNDAETALWMELRGRRLNGHKFVRQFPIGNYFADFACRECGLVVEVDGSQHAEISKAEDERNRFLRHEGYVVVRYWNSEVMRNIDGVLLDLLGKLKALPDRF